MTVDRKLFSSASEEWYTPRHVLEYVKHVLGGHITLDPCWSPMSFVQAEKWWTKDNDGLSRVWNSPRIFCNPPYGRGIGKWTRRAAEATGTVLLLAPARTDTIWFHELLASPRLRGIVFIKGRLKFATPAGESTVGAPFPSAMFLLGGDVGEQSRLYSLQHFGMDGAVWLMRRG